MSGPPAIANTVITLRSSGNTGNVPTVASLANGELTINYADGILYYKTASNTLGSITNTQPSGLNKEIQFNDSGIFAGNSRLTFNKSDGLLTAGNLTSNIATVNNYILFGDGSRQYSAANTNNLTVSLIDTSGNVSNVVSNVSALRFDVDSGFNVNALSQGIVKVGINSTFKYWKVNGTTYLTAQGLDTVNFLPTNGITITANGNASPQSITFDGSSIFDKTNAAYQVANSAGVYANAAFAAANTGGSATDSWARDAANSAGSYANSAYAQANTGSPDSWARSAANSASSYANGAFTFANTVNTYAYSAYSFANTSNSYFYGVNAQQNTNITSASSYANGAFTAANTADQRSVTSGSYANSAYQAANSAGVYANAAFAVANTIAPISITVDNFTGSGSQTVYSLSTTPSNINYTLVSVGGLFQPKTTYSISGSVLTFTSAPGNNAPIEISTIFAGSGTNSGSTASGNSITLSNTTLTATANGLTLTTGNFSSSGDSIVKDYILRGTTTNATETELLIDGNNRISISSNSTMFYTVDIVGRRTDVTNQNAAFHLKGVAINNSGIASDAGSLYEIVIHRDIGTWSIDARANNTTDTVNIYVTGAASSNVRWVAHVKTVEVLQ